MGSLTNIPLLVVKRCDELVFGEDLSTFFRFFLGDRGDHSFCQITKLKKRDRINVPLPG